jgi:hypothetical protein
MVWTAVVSSNKILTNTTIIAWAKIEDELPLGLQLVSILFS